MADRADELAAGIWLVLTALDDLAVIIRYPLAAWLVLMVVLYCRTIVPFAQGSAQVYRFWCFSAQSYSTIFR